MAEVRVKDAVRLEDALKVQLGKFALACLKEQATLSTEMSFGIVGMRLPNLHDRSGEFCVYQLDVSHLCRPKICNIFLKLTKPVMAFCPSSGHTPATK